MAASNVLTHLANHERFVSRLLKSRFQQTRDVATVALACDTKPILVGQHRFVSPETDINAVYSLIDVPAARWRGKTGWWFAGYRLGQRFGMPGVWPSTRMGGADLRGVGGDFLREDPRRSEIAVRLSWAATSCALFYKRSWRRLARALQQALHIEAEDHGILLLGSNRYDPRVTQDVHSWTPRVFLGFPHSYDRRMLFDQCIGKGSWGGEEGAIFNALRDDYHRWAQDGVWYAPAEGAVAFDRKGVTIQSTSLKIRLPLPGHSKPLIAPGSRVKVGEPVAVTADEQMHEVAHLKPSEAWPALNGYLGKATVRQRLANWFCWQCISIPDCSFFHVSMRYAAPAARHADPDATAIDVGPCADFYDDRLSCYFLPPLSAFPWDRFYFALGGISLNLIPWSPMLSL
ncbi:hypothetical protein AYO44_03660 [Planctomycetaceae bacterium SCGC AG-212-F19]|nr:hypothetical protein AYO44_03660 [Planctomycetaceae bacterium SCGC AG-212-F19]